MASSPKRRADGIVKRGRRLVTNTPGPSPVESPGSSTGPSPVESPLGSSTGPSSALPPPSQLEGIEPEPFNPEFLSREINKNLLTLQPKGDFSTVSEKGEGAAAADTISAKHPGAPEESGGGPDEQITKTPPITPVSEPRPANPARTERSRLTDEGLTPPQSAISVVAAPDPLRRSYSEASGSRERLSGVKTARQASGISFVRPMTPETFLWQKRSADAKGSGPGLLAKHPFLSALSFGVIGGAGVLVALSTVFASVNIMVSPRKDTVAIENIPVTFRADAADVNPDQHVIPAQFLTITKSVSEAFPATGNAMAAEKSKGMAKIYNGFGSQPQTLIARTRFVTEEGLVYRLPKSIVVPGASIENGKIVPRFIEAELFADEAGEGFNRKGPLKMTIPGFKGTPRHDGFWAEAADGFNGGFRGEARVVSGQDRTGAEEQITKRAFDGIKQELSSLVPPPLTTAEGLHEIEITSLTVPEENTRADRFDARADATARIVAYRPADIALLLGHIILKNDTGRSIIPDEINVRFRLTDMNAEEKRAYADMRGEAGIRYAVNPDDVAAKATGKTKEEIARILKELQVFSGFRISFFPPWRSRAPSNPAKVRVVTENPEN